MLDLNTIIEFFSSREPIAHALGARSGVLGGGR